MASASAAQAIEDRLKANYTVAPIFAPNEVAEPYRVDGRPAKHIVLEFPGGVGDQITIGTPGINVFRETGAFMIHVMVPAGEGAAAARAEAATISAIFRDKDFNGVTCWAPFPPAEDTASDGSYYGVSFGTPYQFDLHA